METRHRRHDERLTGDPMMTTLPTLDQHLGTRTGPGAVDADLRALLGQIAGACMGIAANIRAAAFRGLGGAAGDVNVQGEEQKKLDVASDIAFAEACARAPRVAALISEERDETLWCKDPEAGDFIVYYDPLDGSSNIDVNLSVGSIFSICRVSETGARNVLIPGRRQICAGYAIYGPSLMLVLTTGGGVDGFSLDPDSGAFHLTHPAMTIPAHTSEFAINASRYHHWEAPVRAYVDDCLAGASGARGRAFNMRWTASMVADVHRILNRGGVFLYPVDAENRAKGGKLRLLYEANPMGMIAEQAGGMASTGHSAILDVAPEAPHQRVAVILGSRDEVARIDALHSDAADAPIRA